jgi:hypothetical protein
MAYKISYGKLKLLKDCPCCFWWSMKKNIGHPPSPMSQIPNRIQDAYQKNWLDSRKNGTLPKELSEIKEAKLIDKTTWNLWQYGKAFSSYTCKNGVNFSLHLRIDDVLIQNENLIVLDIKTVGAGDENVNETKLLTDIERYGYKTQLELYSYIIDHLESSKNVSLSTLDFGYLLFVWIKERDSAGRILTKESLIKVDIDKNNIPKLLEEASEILKKEEPPKLHRACNHCSTNELRHQHKMSPPPLIEGEKGYGGPEPLNLDDFDV